LTLAAIPDRVAATAGVLWHGVFSCRTALALSKVFWFSRPTMVFRRVRLGDILRHQQCHAQRRVPDAMRGRVMGLYSLSFVGLFPFGSLQAGARALRQSAVRDHLRGLRVRAGSIVVVRLVPPAREPVSEPCRSQPLSPARVGVASRVKSETVF